MDKYGIRVADVQWVLSLPDHVCSDVYVLICHNLCDWKIVFEHTELGAGGMSALWWGILEVSTVTVLIIWIYDLKDISQWLQLQL
jgi:hypothetical protein